MLSATSKLLWLHINGNDPSKSLIRIVYYPVTQKSVTQYSTFQEVLHYSKETPNESRQSVPSTTFEGLSTSIEQIRTLEESHYYNRYFPSFYGLLQDDWKRNDWIWFWQCSRSTYKHSRFSNRGNEW